MQNNKILKQFGIYSEKSGYKIGKIINVNSSTNTYSVEVSNGFEILIKDDSAVYKVDDYVILSTSGKEINSTFIIKKIGKNTPNSTNNFINLDEDWFN